MKYFPVLLVMLFLYSCTDYSISEGQVILNPNKTTPLSGIYRLNEVSPEKIEITIKGKTEDMDIEHTFPANYGLDIPIHGLYPDFTNTVIIKSGKSTFTNYIVTPKIDFDSVKVTVDNLPKSDSKNQDFYFVSHALKDLPEDERNVMIAYDKVGDIRYLNYNHKLHYMMYSNNQILIKNNNGIYDLLNNELFSYKKKTGLHVHHDSLEIDDRYVLLVNSKWGVEDRVVELNSEESIVRDLYFAPLFRDIITDPKEIKIMNTIIYDQNNIYKKNGKTEPIDWAHANSLVYDEESDIMYFSLRHQGVIAVDYSEWKLLWWMTDLTLDTIHEGVPNRGMNFMDLPSLAAYRVNGVGSTDGPKNQHALFLLKNGNLGMFDNVGDEEIKTNEGSRYIEYKISGKHGEWKAEKIKEYKDDALYSFITSDVDFLENGNMLITWGIPEMLKEVDSKGNTVFEMRVRQGWFLYRADKMPFYPYDNKRKKYSKDANLKNSLTY